MSNEKKREAGIIAGRTHTRNKNNNINRVKDVLITLHNIGRSSRQIAQHLNDEGVQGPRNKGWNQMTILRYLKRLRIAGLIQSP